MELYYGKSRECLRKKFSEKLLLLQEKLNRKAKLEPKFRFYTLYTHISRWDVLWAAWEMVKRNNGSPGIDNVSIADIKAREGGVDQYLKEIRQDLLSKEYKPQPIKRIYIPKSDGKSKRPLGIPTVRDRIVQAAIFLILEPIFEADFLDNSYGFRPDKSAHDALKETRTTLKEGFRTVYDLDIKGYFDNIPHDKLMDCLRMRIVDRHLLKLIRLILQAPIIEEENGKTTIKPNSSGTPQGGVLSPLLANVYLHWFDVVFQRNYNSNFAKLIRYCDDLIILTKYHSKDMGKFIRDKLENWMGLRISPEKSKIIPDLKESKGGLNTLGYMFRYKTSKYNKADKYLDMHPSYNTLQNARRRVNELFDRSNNFIPIKDLIIRLNLYTKGWVGYFSLGYPSKIHAKLNYHITHKLYTHCVRRSQRPMKPKKGQTWYQMFTDLGVKWVRKAKYGRRK